MSKYYQSTRGLSGTKISDIIKLSNFRQENYNLIKVYFHLENLKISQPKILNKRLNWFKKFDAKIYNNSKIIKKNRKNSMKCPKQKNKINNTEMLKTKFHKGYFLSTLAVSIQVCPISDHKHSYIFAFML